MKMKGTVYKGCVRAAMVYCGETWVIRKVEEGVLQRAERAILRMMCGVKLRDGKNSMELVSMAGLGDDIVTLVRSSRLRCCGHTLRRYEGIVIIRASEFEVESVAGGFVRAVGIKPEQLEKDIVKAVVTGCETSNRC